METDGRYSMISAISQRSISYYIKIRRKTKCYMYNFPFYSSQHSIRRGSGCTNKIQRTWWPLSASSRGKHLEQRLLEKAFESGREVERQWWFCYDDEIF